ncbi:MAG TPA: sigma-70 family RNA polymerase sigma factor [Planctomycetes bacterium]|nr:sigma-70 family RNA polymerase sigma factor [Planctomycetota bacterium]
MPVNQGISLLLSQACQGDSAAIESLMAEIRPRLEGMIRCRLGPVPVDWMEVEDLIQEVQVALIPALSRFEGEGASSFFAYLSGIVRHKVKDHYRRVGARSAGRSLSSLSPQSNSFGSSGDFFTALQDSMTGPSSRVARAELFELLVEQVSELPERQREAVLMAFIDGLDSKEIGEALDLKRSAAAMLVLRGVRNLKKLWRRQRERMS